jgi:hypothetical protein
MALVRAVLSPLLFGLVGLTFLLPFAVVSIDNEGRLLLTQAWSGVDLVTGAEGEYRVVATEFDGTVYDLHGSEITRISGIMVDPDEGLFVPRQPALTVAMLGILAGVLALLLPRAAARTLVSTVAAFITIGALSIGLWLVLRRLEQQFGSHPPYLSYPPGSGFWLAAGLLVLISVGNAVALHRNWERRRRPAVGPPTVPGGRGSATHRQ